jgi:two-component system OmpR family sensor kinase
VSLRARLSILLIAVALVGLTVANVFVYVVVGRYLEDRLDQQVRSLSGPGLALLRAATVPSVPAGSSRPSGVNPAGAWVELRDPSGRRLSGRYLLEEGESDRRPPEFPDVSLDQSGEPVFVDGEAETDDGSIPYRAMFIRMPDGDQLVAGLPANEIRDTKQSLILIELVATAAVLLLTLGLAWLLVGVGLRPLRRIEERAQAIAAGGLSDRIEPADERTEIGRLGLALNTMLDRIEAAFGARERSERRLRRFVADASHDLRTPLASISGYAEVLARPELKADQRENAVRRIRDESARLGKLVRDLLLLARLDESTPLMSRETDVTALVRDLVADARAAAPARPIELVADEHVLAEVDPDHFPRAITNLLANAIQHTPAASPVEVRVRHTNGKVVVEVADHGPGIDPALSEQLFERFTRADPARSSTSGGSGLGLAIAAAVAAAHGGRCEVASTNGGGATFTLTVPARAIRSADDARIAATTASRDGRDSTHTAAG